MSEDAWGPVRVEVVADDAPSEGRRPGAGRPVGLVMAGAVIVVVVGLLIAAPWRSQHHAAPGYPTGAPVARDPRYGATVAASVRFPIAAVADPDGGAPWGLRTFTTTGGYGCAQIGRVQDGRLGVLALVGAGGRTVAVGRFHPLPAAAAVHATTCLPLDGAEHAYLAVHAVLTTAGTAAPCWFDSAGSTGLLCPAATTRTIDAGLLGPRATALSARVGGRARTLRTRGGDGAYLVVQRPVRPTTIIETLNQRAYAVPAEAPLAQTPASNVVLRVAYRGAPSCRVHPTLGRRGACAPPPGFVPVVPSDAVGRPDPLIDSPPDRRG